MKEACLKRAGFASSEPTGFQIQAEPGSTVLPFLKKDNNKFQSIFSKQSWNLMYVVLIANKQLEGYGYTVRIIVIIKMVARLVWWHTCR